MSSGDSQSSVPSDGTINETASTEQEMMRRLVSLTERVDQIASTLTLRDVILKALETSVTSLAEEWRPLKEFLDEKVKEVEETQVGGLQMLQSVGINLGERGRKDCIDVMIMKTIIPGMNEEKMSQVRVYYEELYNASPETASLFEFLKFQLCVRITVDSDAHHIGNIKHIFYDHMGYSQEGKDFYKFVDCPRQQVFLAGGLTYITHRIGIDLMERDVIGHLALSLTEMSLYLAFKNEGLPYCKDDNEMSELYKSIVEEAKKKQNDGVKFDPFVLCALNIHKDRIFYGGSKAQMRDEVELICAVPRIMAWYGGKVGQIILREQLPSLLDYYTDRVMSRLFRETEAARSA